MIVADEAGRLQSVYERVLFRQLPVKGNFVPVVVPHPVKPDAVHLAVTRQQFCELVVHEMVITVPVSLFRHLPRVPSRASHGIIVACPVNVRVVQVQPHLFLVASVRQLFHHVLAVRRVHDVVVRAVRVPHRETVVVSRREADVFRSSRFERFDPLSCVEVVRIEGACRFGILRLVNPLILHEPFALSEQTVKSPVQEYSEA